MTPDLNPRTANAIMPARADSISDRTALLNSVVTVARAVFCAAASSLMLLDGDAGELVFEAVSGNGQQDLVKTRFPAGRGIAGWVVTTHQPLIVDKLEGDAMFARDVAESTGYVPSSIMAVPVCHNDSCVGVLEVLDPHPEARASLPDLDLLTMLASQAAIALGGFTRATRGDGNEHGAISTLVTVLQDSTGPRRAATVQLLSAVTTLLVQPASSP